MEFQQTCASLECEEACCSYPFLPDHCCSKEEYKAQNSSHHAAIIDEPWNFSDIHDHSYLDHAVPPDNVAYHHEIRLNTNRYQKTCPLLNTRKLVQVFSCNYARLNYHVMQTQWLQQNRQMLLKSITINKTTRLQSTIKFIQNKRLPNFNDYENPRWDHFDLVISLLVVGVVTTVLLLAIFCALRYRRKYMKFKREHAVVTHNVEREGIIIESSFHTPIAANNSPDAIIAEPAITGEKQRQPSAGAEAPTANTPPSYKDLYAKDSGATRNNDDYGNSK